MILCGDTVKTAHGTGTVIDTFDASNATLLKVLFANGQTEYFNERDVTYVASMKDIALAIANMG